MSMTLLHTVRAAVIGGAMLLPGCQSINQSELERLQQEGEIIFVQREAIPLKEAAFTGAYVFIHRTGYTAPLYVRPVRIAGGGVRVDLFRLSQQEVGLPGVGDSSDQRKVGEVLVGYGKWTLTLKNGVQSQALSNKAMCMLEAIALLLPRNAPQVFRISVSDTAMHSCTVEVSDVPLRPGGSYYINISDSGVKVEASY